MPQPVLINRSNRRYADEPIVMHRKTVIVAYTHSTAPYLAWFQRAPPLTDIATQRLIIERVNETSVAHRFTC
jgi:hypothetical protein